MDNQWFDATITDNHARRLPDLAKTINRQDALNVASDNFWPEITARLGARTNDLFCREYGLTNNAGRTLLKVAITVQRVLNL